MSKNYDITTIKKAIEDSNGLVQNVAQKLGCEWHTAKKYIELYDETKLAYENENESVLDFVESKLMENIEANDNTAILFYLKTKGKKRGFIERNEVDLTNKGEKFENQIITTLTPEQLKESLKK